MSEQPQDRATIIAAATEALNTVSGKLEAVSVRLDQVKQDSEDRDADLAKQDERLRKYGKVNRALIWVGAIGLAFDIAASGIAWYALDQEHHAQVAAARNAATVTQLHANSVAACQSGNIRTSKQLKALDNILGVGGPPKTPQQAAFIAKAEGFVADGWSQRDCQKIYAINRP